MATKKRDYAAEYRKYQGTPEQIAARSNRNKARRAYEKANGDLPSTTDVAHKRALSKGGAPVNISNLKAEGRSSNRSFARTSTNKLKSEISKRERSR
jgi:hypothetical protein